MWHVNFTKVRALKFQTQPHHGEQTPFLDCFSSPSARYLCKCRLRSTPATRRRPRVYVSSGAHPRSSAIDDIAGKFSADVVLQLQSTTKTPRHSLASRIRLSNSKSRASMTITATAPMAPTSLAPPPAHISPRSHRPSPRE